MPTTQLRSAALNINTIVCLRKIWQLSDSPPEGQMEGQRAVAIHPHQREDGRPQAQDDCARHSGGIQGLGIAQQR